MGEIKEITIKNFIDDLYIIEYEFGEKIIATKDISRRNHLDVMTINVIDNYHNIKEQYYYIMSYIDFLQIYN